MEYKNFEWVGSEAKKAITPEVVFSLPPVMKTLPRSAASDKVNDFQLNEANLNATRILNPHRASKHKKHETIFQLVTTLPP